MAILRASGTGIQGETAEGSVSGVALYWKERRSRDSEGGRKKVPALDKSRDWSFGGSVREAGRRAAWVVNKRTVGGASGLLEGAGLVGSTPTSLPQASAYAGLTRAGHCVANLQVRPGNLQE